MKAPSSLIEKKKLTQQRCDDLETTSGTGTAVLWHWTNEVPLCRGLRPWRVIEELLGPSRLLLARRGAYPVETNVLREAPADAQATFAMPGKTRANAMKCLWQPSILLRGEMAERNTPFTSQRKIH